VATESLSLLSRGTLDLSAESSPKVEVVKFNYLQILIVDCSNFDLICVFDIG
jgi:hypothetical protein